MKMKALSLAAMTAVLAAAGCKGGGASTSLLVTAEAETALALDQIALSVGVAGKAPVKQTLAAAASVSWTVVFPDLKAPVTVDAEAVGLKGGSGVVTAWAQAAVLPGQQARVTLRLTSRCLNVTCPTGQTCADGACVGIQPPPVNDGGADAARDAGSDRPATSMDAGDAGVPPADARPDLPGADTGPMTCPAGQHNCGGCVDDNSPLHCGTKCDPCSAPDGGAASCTAGACDFSCGTLKKCNGTCISGCCSDADCPAQAGKVGTCDTASHACSYNCAADQKSCNGTCIPKTSCCTRADCPAACQTCNTAGACVALVNADDSNKTLCPGTCDAQGVCKSKRGQSCTTVAGGCVAGSVCAPDGFCCDRACTGPCEACDNSATPGTCGAVTGAPHIGHTTCAGSTAACAGSCTGAATGQCTYPTTACGTATCTNQTNAGGQVTGTSVVARGTCSAGACAVPAATSCAGSLTCASASACRTSCTADTDCLAGNTCAGGVCTPRKANGAACAAAGECTSGFCADGVCCESGCTGLCMACTATRTGATNGQCRGVMAATDPDNECAADTANPCGRDGFCDGAGACRLRVSGTSCGSASCSGNTLTPAGRCNGSGTCTPGTPAVCPGNFPCGSATACATTCTARSTTGCVSGYSCVNGNSCVRAIVPCGNASCAVGDGSKCCQTDPDADGVGPFTYTCIPPGATCSSLSVIVCDSQADCPAPQYCCIFGNGCNPSHWDGRCVDDVTKCVSGFMSFGYQLCDPTLNPSECVTGSCQTSGCVPGLFGCR